MSSLEGSEGFARGSAAGLVARGSASGLELLREQRRLHQAIVREERSRRLSIMMGDAF